MTHEHIILESQENLYPMPRPEGDSSPPVLMSETLAILCREKEIYLDTATNYDRQDIALTARDMFRTRAGLADQAMAAMVDDHRPSPLLPREQVRANLRDFYNNTDLDTRDRVVYTRQCERDKPFIRLAGQCSSKYTEIRQAHILLRELHDQGKKVASSAILDLLVAYGTAIDQNHKAWLQAKARQTAR